MASSKTNPTVTGVKDHHQPVPVRSNSNRRKLCSLITDGHYAGRRDLLGIATTKIWNINVAKLHMNAYIIIGEQPTYPHYLITIKRTLSPVHSTPSFHGIGTIVLWHPTYLQDLVQREQLRLTPSHPTFMDQPSDDALNRYIALSFESNVSTNLPGQKTLLGLHTVWDVERDRLAQFQFFNTYIDVFSNPIYAYGFVYGSCQYALFSPEGSEEGYSVCFRGLSGPKQGAHVKAITVGRLLVLEPFVEKYRKHIIAGWSSTHLKWKGENGFDAVLSDVNLLEIALEVIKTSASYTSSQPSSDIPFESPTAIKPYACFTPGYLDQPVISASDWLKHRNDIELTLGFVIPRSKTYHLFQFTISLSTRTIRVLRTLKVGNISPILLQYPAEQLFLRVAGKCKLLPPESHNARHVCNQACMNRGLEEDGLKGFVDFDVAQSVDSLLLPKNGVRLLAPGQRMYRESLCSYDEAAETFEDEDEEWISTDVSTNTSFGSMLSSDQPSDMVDRDQDGDILMASQHHGSGPPNEFNNWATSASFGSFGPTEPDEEMVDDSQASTIKVSQSQKEADPYLELALSTLVEGKNYSAERERKQMQVKPLRRTKATEGGLFGSVPLLPMDKDENSAKREGSVMKVGPIKRARLLSSAPGSREMKNDGMWDMTDSE